MKKIPILVVLVFILLAVMLFFQLLLQEKESTAGIPETKASQPINPEFSKTNPEAATGSAINDHTAPSTASSFPVQWKYADSFAADSYVVALEGTVSVLDAPREDGAIVGTLAHNEKSICFSKQEQVLETGEKTSWYEISLVQEGMEVRGYVSSRQVQLRSFRYAKAEAAVNLAQRYADIGSLTYIDNWKERNGKSPLYRGKTEDTKGNHRAQSAPGYPDPTNLSEFFYIADGTLVRYLSERGDLIRTEIVATGETLYIPNRYLPKIQAVTDLKKLIAIDLDQQNELVYEKIDGTWTLISRTFATTGKIGTYSSPTPKGFFYAIELRKQFYYYKDGTTMFQGYAPYAIRFTDSAYIHGIPVDFHYTSQGTRVVPGHRETSSTIGTIPLSHKCVRNNTSHAKFLYDWFSTGETIVVIF